MAVPQRKLTRRTALGLAGGAAAAAAVGPAASRAFAAARQRVVVVGGGVAGVSTAWLLDGAHDVTLLEAAPQLGGHARSIGVTTGGRQVQIDAGAQYFGPKSHPRYWKLLTQVLKVPTVAAPMNLTVNRRGAARPMIVSPDNKRVWPLFDPRFWPALVSLAIFTDAGRKLDESGDTSVTAEEFIGGLPLLQWVRDDVLYPLAGAMFGFSVPQVKQMSARSVVAFVVRGLGDGFLAPYDYHNAVDGLSAVVRAMQGGLSTVDARVGAAATRLVRSGATWQVHDATGKVHTADHVVLALPPYAAAPLVAQLAGGQPVADVHRRFPYLPAKVAIHTDPTFMPADKGVWSGFNVLSDGQFCEPTMYLGAFRPGTEVFKSWVSHRREQPKNVVATFDYLHAHETPGYMRAQADLNAKQGEQNLWFAGTHMNDVSSQENALVSAMRVAQRLNPGSARLTAL